MFSRSRRDLEPDDIIDSFPAEVAETELVSNLNDEDIQLKNSWNNQPEIVQVVEKISGILSPYFIVLVGLVLYKENVFIANLLIFIGIFSLLKISWRDLGTFFEGLKNFLGLDRSPDDTIN